MMIRSIKPARVRRITYLFCAALCLLTAACTEPAPSVDQAAPGGVLLPTDYQGGLFFVEPVTTTGDTLRLFTDTGGGMVIQAEAVERLGLPSQRVEEGGRSFRVAALPPFQSGHAVPLPQTPDSTLLVREGERPAFANMDGILGTQWFADRYWTLDYERGQIRHHDTLPAVFDTAQGAVPLAFNTREDGTRANAFPIIDVAVGGDTLQALFDTGATLALTDSAHAALDDGRPAVRGGSFLAASVFDRWRAEHPTWRVVDGADRVSARMYGTSEPILEVPAITIGEHTVGPVWFVRRRDDDLRWMSQFTGTPVQAAMGGSALHHFDAIHMDYPGGQVLLVP